VGRDDAVLLDLRARQVAQSVDAGLLDLLSKWFAALLYITLFDSIINVLLHVDGGLRLFHLHPVLSDMDIADRATAAFGAQSFLVVPLAALFFLWICGLTLLLKESGIIRMRSSAGDLARRLLLPGYNLFAANSIAADIGRGTLLLGGERDIRPLFGWWWPTAVTAAPFPMAMIVLINLSVEFSDGMLWSLGLLSSILFLGAAWLNFTPPASAPESRRPSGLEWRQQ
jgi:hypothetical protein